MNNLSKLKKIYCNSNYLFIFKIENRNIYRDIIINKLFNVNNILILSIKFSLLRRININIKSLNKCFIIAFNNLNLLIEIYNTYLNNYYSFMFGYYLDNYLCKSNLLSIIKQSKVKLVYLIINLINKLIFKLINYINFIINNVN